MRTILAMLMLPLAPCPAWAAAENIVCPESISVAPQTMAKRVEGWRYFSDPEARYPLDAVMIYAGKKSLAEVPPGKGTESYSQWRFSDNGDESYWIVCSYKRSSLLLKRQLDTKFTSCKLSFEEDKASPGARQVMHKMVCE